MNSEVLASQHLWAAHSPPGPRQATESRLGMRHSKEEIPFLRERSRLATPSPRAQAAMQASPSARYSFTGACRRGYQAISHGSRSQTWWPTLISQDTLFLGSSSSSVRWPTPRRVSYYGVSPLPQAEAMYVGRRSLAAHETRRRSAHIDGRSTPAFPAARQYARA